MSTSSDHSQHDMRSLYTHRLIARKLQADPGLLAKAWQNIAAAREVADLDAFVEWEVVLRSPLDKLCDFISKPSQVATRLRQSSPFIGFITQEERQRINEQVKLRASDSSSSEYHR